MTIFLVLLSVVGADKHEVISACISAGVPEISCGILVETLAESGGKAHLVCGASNECVALCGSEPDGVSRECRVQCAMDTEGNVRRVSRCNDRGKSKGYFQLREANLAVCRDNNMGGDPHDIVSASKCYAYLAARSYRANVCRLPLGEHRWAVSFARVAAGVFHRGTKVPRCTPHSYALRSMAKRGNFQVASP